MTRKAGRQSVSQSVTLLGQSETQSGVIQLNDDKQIELKLDVVRVKAISNNDHKHKANRSGRKAQRIFFNFLKFCLKIHLANNFAGNLANEYCI